jgi:YVTN family beta-propeller protein
LSIKTLVSGVLLVLQGISASAATATAGRLYVSDERGGAVVIVDAGSGAITGRVNVGKRPRGMQLAPDGRHLYVALSGSAIAGPGVDESSLPPPDRRFDGIGVIDLATARLQKTLPGGTDPETLAVSPDGRTLYVANEDGMQLTSIDVASGTTRARVNIGVEPEGVAVRPDGKVVYVTCEGAGAVYAIDASSLQVIAKIPTRARPRAIVFARDGKLGFVSDEIGAAITVFDTASQQVVRAIVLPATGDALLRPMGLATTPDGKSLYVTTGRGGALLEIDLASMTQKRSIAAVGQRPWGLALNTAGDMAYTANGPSGDISMINLATGQVERRVNVGGSPWGVVFHK